MAILNGMCPFRVINEGTVCKCNTDCMLFDISSGSCCIAVIAESLQRIADNQEGE